MKWKIACSTWFIQTKKFTYNIDKQLKIWRLSIYSNDRWDENKSGWLIVKREWFNLLRDAKEYAEKWEEKK
jgi:hypothetical protein